MSSSKVSRAKTSRGANLADELTEIRQELSGLRREVRDLREWVRGCAVLVIEHPDYEAPNESRMDVAVEVAAAEVLAALDDAGEPLSPGELADRLSLSVDAVQAALDRLVANGELQPVEDTAVATQHA